MELAILGVCGLAGSGENPVLLVIGKVIIVGGKGTPQIC